MYKIFFKSVLTVVFLASLLTGCKKDNYEYPSVALDFLTVILNQNGTIDKIITDDFKSFTDIDWPGEKIILPKMPKGKPNRLLANYEILENNKNGKAIKIYNAKLMSMFFPQVLDNNLYPQQPIEIGSIWEGAGYMNLGVKVLSENLDLHKFGYIQEKVETNGDTRDVYIRLLHENKNDKPYYYQTLYMSVPIYQYMDNGIEKLNVHFEYKDYSEKQQVYNLQYKRRKILNF